MDLPVMPPVAPMLAKAAEALPDGDGWLFEPKWDGFRCLVFRDGDEVELTSRQRRPLTRYFPELPEPLRDVLPERVVTDGELVVPTANGLDFDKLGQRIHPAASRVARLAAETPATYLVFDLLALGDRDLRPEPLATRRALLDEVLAGARPPVLRSPSTTDRAVAEVWFDGFEGAGLDGVVAKRLDGPYVPGERLMVKVKHHRTADVVVGGFRWHKDGQGVGSLLCGLYDDGGALHYLGVASGFSASLRRTLAAELHPLTTDALVGHPWEGVTDPDPTARTGWSGAGQRMPGGVSRWNAARDLSWVPVRPERVAEVRFDQMQAGRFRHSARFVRWRPDRDAASCTYAQLAVVTPLDLRALAGD